MHPSEQPPRQLPDTAPRFLCVCEGGNCRSVSLALMLKATKEYDAIACSWKDIAPYTFQMLAQWADAIVVMQGYMLDKVPEEYHKKTNVLDVGEDVWCNPFSPELRDKIKKLLEAVPINVRRSR